MNNINVLDVEVSYFKSCTDVSNPTAVNLLTFLRSEKHRAAVERVRAVEGKAERDALKKKLLPGITPSGVFTHRAENGLVKHSGLIAGDVDMKDNPYNPRSLKDFISQFENVAYCGLSASGRGIWFLIPIAHPERHKEHFASLLHRFAKDGIKLDPAPANVASLRFYSYDPDAYFNPAAKPYARLLTAAPDTYTPAPRRHVKSASGNKEQRIAAHIEAAIINKMKIEDVVAKFLPLQRAGSRLKSLCPFHDERTPSFYVTPSMAIFKCFGCGKGGGAIEFLKEHEKMNYRAALEWLAVFYGIELEYENGDEKDAHSAPQSPTAPQNAHDEQQAILARMIEKNPLVSELITRFDLKLENSN